MEVNGCIGCNACRYGKACVQKYDFNDLVPKIKAFIERFYCIAYEKKYLISNDII